jgi:putative toxin-antitoxin system antitoxin component (TIGR02293 family)
MNNFILQIEKIHLYLNEQKDVMPAAAITNRSLIKTKFKGLGTLSNHSIVFSARKGLKTKVFYDFATAISMPEKNLALLINLSPRTISNYKEKRKSLEPVYSEHLLKIIALFGKGEEIFGNIAEFSYWLNKPFWNSKQKPIEWIVTSGGVDLVMEEIDKLAQGYPA